MRDPLTLNQFLARMPAHIRRKSTRWQEVRCFVSSCIHLLANWVDGGETTADHIEMFLRLRESGGPKPPPAEGPGICACGGDTWEGEYCCACGAQWV